MQGAERPYPSGHATIIFPHPANGACARNSEAGIASTPSAGATSNIAMAAAKIIAAHNSNATA